MLSCNCRALHRRQIALQLHCKCAAIALPLHFRCVALALLTQCNRILLHGNGNCHCVAIARALQLLPPLQSHFIGHPPQVSTNATKLESSSKAPSIALHCHCIAVVQDHCVVIAVACHCACMAVPLPALPWQLRSIALPLPLYTKAPICMSRHGMCLIVFPTVANAVQVTGWHRIAIALCSEYIAILVHPLHFVCVAWHVHCH